MRHATPVHLNDVPRPVGPYSPAVRAGDFVYVSGQVPRDPATGALAGDDIATQSRAVLANVRRVLEAAGASTADVVSVVVYLADTDDWAAFNTVYKECFTEPYPSRTAVGCQLRGIRVEVSCVAYSPAPRR
jgi:2-iminobutanoate/2-iminopropanoate deaminase